jgi:mRNA-degrading endonuclease RelE of RelBE toxin-antitoxin system
MVYELRYSDVAVEQLRKLRAFDRTAVLDQIERRLATAPTNVTKTALKKLRQPAPTQYRLRAGEHRVYYNVDGEVRSDSQQG